MRRLNYSNGDVRETRMCTEVIPMTPLSGKIELESKSFTMKDVFAETQSYRLRVHFGYEAHELLKMVSFARKSTYVSSSKRFSSFHLFLSKRLVSQIPEIVLSPNIIILSVNFTNPWNLQNKHLTVSIFFSKIFN